MSLTVYKVVSVLWWVWVSVGLRWLLSERYGLCLRVWVLQIDLSSLEVEFVT